MYMGSERLQCFGERRPWDGVIATVASSGGSARRGALEAVRGTYEGRLSTGHEMEQGAQHQPSELKTLQTTTKLHDLVKFVPGCPPYPLIPLTRSSAHALESWLVPCRSLQAYRLRTPSPRNPHSCLCHSFRSADFRPSVATSNKAPYSTAHPTPP